MDPQVKNFEEAIKEYTGAKTWGPNRCSIGTDALVIASHILGFENGAEVITSPFTFLASTSCIAKHRATPVFVDIDEETFEMDLKSNRIKVNSKQREYFQFIYSHK